MSYLRLQYMVLAVFLISTSIVTNHYWIVPPNLFVIAVNLFIIRNYLPRWPAKASHRDKDIVSLNAHEDNNQLNKLKSFIKEANPELMLIMEMTDEIEASLKEVLKRYPYNLTTPVRDGFRISLYSKAEFSETKITNYGENNTPLLQAKTSIKGVKYIILSAHPKPPLKQKWFEERQNYFNEIKSLINENDLPIIMLGDFNSAPWESHFRDFTQSTGLKSTLERAGYKVTCPPMMMSCSALSHLYLKLQTKMMQFALPTIIVMVWAAAL